MSLSKKIGNELRNHFMTLSKKVHVMTDSKVTVMSLFQDTIQ